jgi:hypothetical protein
VGVEKQGKSGGADVDTGIAGSVARAVADSSSRDGWLFQIAVLSHLRTIATRIYCQGAASIGR